MDSNKNDKATIVTEKIWDTILKSPDGDTPTILKKKIADIIRRECLLHYIKPKTNE